MTEFVEKLRIFTESGRERPGDIRAWIEGLTYKPEYQG
jgi:hypothetical protein